MCATGTILAFEPQITQWSERALQTVTPPVADAKRLDNEILIAKAQATKPEAKLSFLSFKADPSASVMAGFGRDGVLFLNPYTGEVLGEGSKTRETLHKIEEWHRWLGNRRIGKPITGAAAIAFFLLSLSGIYLWWPRKVFTTVGIGHGRNWNWHNTFGIASAFFILIITSTGITMSHYGLLNNRAEHGQRMPQTVRILAQPAPRPQNLRVWITPLHTGRAWGLPGQTINFLCRACRTYSNLDRLRHGLAALLKRKRRNGSMNSYSSDFGRPFRRDDFSGTASGLSAGNGTHVPEFSHRDDDRCFAISLYRNHGSGHRRPGRSLRFRQQRF